VAWVQNNKVPMSMGLLAGLAVLIISIMIAWVTLKLYDEPVRKWLTDRYLKK
jgi:peptidoglycan/LPS O-acetylase OafA/YrhL